eukprot:5872570-Ditylum_brightwellii.AAC.1
MHFNPTDPVDTIFTEIEDFSDVAKIVYSPVSEIKKINMVYLILQKAHKFKLDLKAWNCQSQSQKTWQNFKMISLVEQDVRQALEQHKNYKEEKEHAAPVTEVINMTQEELFLMKRLDNIQASLEALQTQLQAQ